MEMRSGFRERFILTWVVFMGLAIVGVVPVKIIDAEDPPNPMMMAPKAEEIMQRLQAFSPHRKHPRLLAGTEDFSRLQRLLAQDAYLKNAYNKLKTATEKILKEPPVRYELPDGVRLLEISRKALLRISNLAFMYRMTLEKKYAERAWLELQTISDPTHFADWHPAHYLDTAEMAAAAAIGFDWLYDYLSSEQKDRILLAIERNAFNTAIQAYHGSTWWPKAVHNWNAVCNGGIGIAAMAVGDETPVLSKKAGFILESALKSLPLMIREFAPDGGWGEGIGYWSYANQYLGFFLSSMDLALGTDYGLTNFPGFRETGYFPIYLTGSAAYFNFADDGRGRIARSGALYWYAAKFGKPEYSGYARRYPGTGALDLIWYPGETATSRPAGDDRYFRGSETVGLHSCLGADDDIFIGFKAGNNQFNHGDLDIGTFVIDAGGKRWAEDLGKDNYNLPGYFDRKSGGQRWNYYRKRAEGHNTLVLNPSRAADQEPTAKARIEQFEPGDSRAFAIADLTPAYRGKATSVKRGVALIDGKSKILIRDEIISVKPLEVCWFMHTQAQIELRDGGRSAVLSQGNERLLVKLFSPQDAEFVLMDAVPLPTSPDPPGQLHQKKNDYRKLAIRLKGILNGAITVLMTPFQAGVNPPELQYSPISLSEWRMSLK